MSKAFCFAGGPVKKAVNDLKAKMGCLVCSENIPAALDFHHLDRRHKKFSIAAGLGSGRSLDEILEEIKKCVLFCANCHRKFHAGYFCINRKFCKDCQKGARDVISFCQDKVLMQSDCLPPNCPYVALNHVRPQDREDAIQEAWVAYLEGRDPANAIGAFAQREARYRKRVITNMPGTTEHQTTK